MIKESILIWVTPDIINNINNISSITMHSSGATCVKSKSSIIRGKTLFVTV